MTEESRKRDIVHNDGWLGADGGLFGTTSPKKTWKPVPKVQSPNNSASNLNTDFLGGCGYSSPNKVNRPAQIKIEGIRSSIKNNPFLKNDH